MSATHAVTAEVRLYDHLFTKEDPDDVPEGGDWLANINPKSLECLTACRVEPCLANAKPGERYQFERLGYFCVDSDDSSAGKIGLQSIGDAAGYLGENGKRKQITNGKILSKA